VAFWFTEEDKIISTTEEKENGIIGWWRFDKWSCGFLWT